MNATTVQQQNISVGDWDHLQKVLLNAGLSNSEVDQLSDAVNQDGRSIGSRVGEWMKKSAPKVLSGGVRVGASIGQTLLLEYLKQYFGLG